jgi:RND superfamily putative drug exporter
MQSMMLKLDELLRRRRTAVLLLWLVTLIAAVPFAMKQSDHLTGGGFGIPGSESRAVEDTLKREFPEAARGTMAAVVIPRSGATQTEVDAAVRRVQDAARKTADVEPGGRPLQRRAGDPVLVPLRLDVEDLQSTDVAGDLRDRLAIGTESGGPTSTHLVGQGALWAGMQHLSQEDLASAEKTGFPVVLLILLAVFGSLAAATLPLALGVGSVLVTGGIIYFLSMAMEMSVFVTNMASMIGIGVAVDYSLFVLARYREEVRAGRDPDEARRVALATSGVAVLFSGLTVIVSLAGLFMVNANSLRSMAVGAILVVAVSMLAAATLLPALISLLGKRAYARGRLFTIAPLVLRSRARRRRGSTRTDAPEKIGFWERWTAFVTRRPVVSLVAAASILLLLAVPALSLKTSNGALRQFPAGNETRVGAEAAAALSGPGASAKLRVVTDKADAASARRTVAADPGVAKVLPTELSKDGRRALITAIPRTDGESPAAKEMVKRLRTQLSRAQVGGPTATNLDFGDTVSGSMWKIALFVLGLSYIVLLVLLRSVVLPLKAVVMNLLSVGASYGVLVAVFQWGWIDGFLGFQSTGSIDTIVPPLVLAVVFGLSMDYEVFLLSRIRERFGISGDTKRAVAEGLAGSARTITSAALIMVGVFLVFVGTGVPSIKQLGLGNAVAIAVDATLVRLVLVPAAMELLGKWNWWMPKPLARVLPQANLEELAPQPAGAS